MTDKETSLALVERMIASRWSGAGEDERRILILAKTAALIEDHRLGINPWSAYWDVQHRSGHYTEADDLHTAVRAVADKIKEQA